MYRQNCLLEAASKHFSIFDDQNLPHMKKLIIAASLVVVLASATWLACTKTEKAQTTDNANLTLPSGFSARVLIDSIGKARHLAITGQGDIFVKLADAVNGAGIVVLHDNGDAATVKSKFGDFGGTGAYIKN